MADSDFTSLPPFVSVVVPALNCADDVAGFTAAMSRQDYPASRFEVIVVDNGSTDNTLAAARAAGLTGLQRKERGRTKALNTGIAAAKGDFILTTDLSCRAEPCWIRAVVETFNAYPNAGCVAGDIKLLRNNGNAVIDFQDRNEYMSPMLALARTRLPHMPFADGANASFRRKVFEEIGGFEESFVKAGDVEICYRMFVLTDYWLVFNPEALMWEPGEPSLRALLHQRFRMGIGQHLMKMKYPGLYRCTAPPRGPRQIWWSVHTKAARLGRLLKLNIELLKGRNRGAALDANIRELMGWAQWYGGCRAPRLLALQNVEPVPISETALRKFLGRPDPLAGRIVKVSTKTNAAGSVGATTPP